MPRTLQITSTGDDVTFLQERNARPPTALPLLVVNGDFGPETFARVKEYQSNNALNVDGIVESLTWGNLLGYTTSETTGFFMHA